MATARQEASDAITGAGIAIEGCDEALVAGLRSGKRQAFEEFVALYQTSVFNLALRILQQREDARDVAQEVFLKAYRTLPSQRGELRLRPWVYRVTVNACYDHLRACRRRPLAGEADVELSEEPVDQVEQAELARLFRDSLRTLPPRQQIALLLKDVHGLPHCEIAESLGISRGSAEVLLFRARHSFRRSFTSLTAEPDRAVACTFAERAAAEAVGGRLSDVRRRHVLHHAEHCPDCRRTVKGWSGAAVGLGIALPLVAVELFHTSSAAAALAGVAAASSAAAAGSAVGAAGAALLASASGSAAGASAAAAAAGAAATLAAPAVSAGLIAKISTLLTAKAATVAAATTCVLTAGSVTAYEVQQQATPVRGPGPTVAAAADRAGTATKPANAPATARRGSQGTSRAGASAASSAAAVGLSVIHIKATTSVHDQASRIAGGHAATGGRKPGTGGVPHVHMPAVGQAHTEAMRIRSARRHRGMVIEPGGRNGRHQQRPRLHGPQTGQVPRRVKPAAVPRTRPASLRNLDRVSTRPAQRVRGVRAHDAAKPVRGRDSARLPRTQAAGADGCATALQRRVSPRRPSERSPLRRPH
jgi:RNA polymerase sigma-70 factor, ECF subfamily